MLGNCVLRRKLTPPLIPWNASKGVADAVLPAGSTLHRINKHFSPLVKAQPEINVAALKHSIRCRGLIDVFQSGFVECLVS